MLLSAVLFSWDPLLVTHHTHGWERKGGWWVCLCIWCPLRKQALLPPLLLIVKCLCFNWVMLWQKCVCFSCVKLFQEAYWWMFSVFIGFFLLQGLHSLSSLRIKGNVVVYCFGICWTDKALKTGSTYDRFLGGDALWFNRRTVDPKPQNNRLIIWQVMWCSRPPLVAPATSCPRESVATDNGIAITIYTLATCAEYSVMCKCKIAVLNGLKYCLIQAQTLFVILFLFSVSIGAISWLTETHLVPS